MKIPDQSIIRHNSDGFFIFSLMLLASIPSPSIRVVGVFIAVVLFSLKYCHFELRFLFFVTIILWINLLVNFYLVPDASVILFFIQLIIYVPLFALLCASPSDKKIAIKATEHDVKFAIEAYFFVQGFFCLASFLYHFYVTGRGGFDLDGGDVIAGTFRNPFVYKSDAANQEFVYSSLILIFFYVRMFGREVNKFLVGGIFLICLVGSVNHLFLSALASGLLWAVMVRRRGFVWVLLAAFVYVAVSMSIFPKNWFHILNSFSDGFESVEESLNVHSLGRSANLKVLYVLRYLEHFSANFERFFLFGVGLGQYSSRVVVSATNGTIPLDMLSRWSMENSISLFYLGKEYAPYLLGYRHVPWNGWVTMLSEFGFLPAIILLYLYVRKLIFLDSSSRVGISYLLLFVAMACVFGNYMERSTGIFFIFIFSILSSCKLNDNQYALKEKCAPKQGVGLSHDRSGELYQ